MRNKSHAWLALSLAHSFERVSSNQSAKYQTKISHYKRAVIGARLEGLQNSDSFMKVMKGQHVQGLELRAIISSASSCQFRESQRVMVKICEMM